MTDHAALPSDNVAAVAALPTDVVVQSQGAQTFNPALYVGAAAAYLPQVSVGEAAAKFSANSAGDGKTLTANSVSDKALEKPMALEVVSTTDQTNANLIVKADGTHVWNKPVDGKGTMSVYRADQTSDEKYNAALTTAKSQLENGTAKTDDGTSVTGAKKYTLTIPEKSPVELTSNKNADSGTNNSASGDNATPGTDSDPAGGGGGDSSCGGGGGGGSGGGGKGTDGAVNGANGPEANETEETSDKVVSPSGKGLSDVTNKVYPAEQWKQPASFTNPETIVNFARSAVPSVMMNAMMGFDKNGDGKLDANELAEWEKWKTEHPDEMADLEKAGKEEADKLAKEGSTDSAKGVTDFVNGMKADSTKDGTFINDFYKTMKASEKGTLNSDTFNNNSAFTPAFQKGAAETAIMGRLNEAIPNWRKEPLTEASLKVLRDTLAKDVYKYGK